MNQIIGAGGGNAPQQKTYKPKEAKDNLNSTQYATILDLISEGEIQGLKDGNKSIYLNNTPLQNPDGSYNFNNVQVQTRVGTGTGNQTSIPLVPRSSSQVAVGVVATFNTNIVRQITNTDVNAVVITISCPALQKVTEKGDIQGNDFTFIVERQYSGGSYQQVFDEKVSGRSGNQFERSYTVPINGAFPVNIRLRRTKTDSTSSNNINAFNWASYTEIVYAKLAYPSSALVGIRIDASQFNSVPTRSYLIRGIKIKIPSNATVDSSTGRLIYSGNWNGVFAAAQWCSDPAWILWDLLLSKRYGFGDHIDESQLDKWAFYSASQYCAGLVPNGFGGQEPRFSCNVNIQTQQDAYKLINDLASVFRAMPFWSAGALTVTQDKTADPSCLFTLANVSEEGFRYESGSLKNRPTVVVVKYFNIAKQDYDYQAVEDVANIKRYGVIIREVEAFATTSRGQARRVGEWILYSEWNESEVISFTAGISEGVIVRPGQIIDVADPVRAGVRRGGRVISATTTVVTVDATTDMAAASGSALSVITPNGTVESRNVVSINDSTKQVTVSPGFSVAPNGNSIWIQENTALQATQWRVLTVQEQEDINYVVTAIRYNSSKYDFVERDARLEEPSVTLLNQPPLPPQSLAAVEALYENTGKILSKILVSWRAAFGVNSYRIRWRYENSGWVESVQTALDYEIPNASLGVYEIEVYSIRGGLVESASPSRLTFTAFGKLAPPSNVQNFRAELDPNLGVTLKWDAVPDLDLDGYEVWQGSSFGSGIKLGLFRTTSISVGKLPNGTVTWFIKSLDTSEQYSTSAATTAITIFGAGAPPLTGRFRSTDVELSWNAVTGSLATQSYEIRFGSTSSTWATATLAGRVQGTVFTTQALWSGTRRWYVAAIDANGNYGAAASWDGVITAPSQPVVTQQVIDNNVLLQWTDATQTLPLTGYELRKGATWASATVVGTNQARFTSLFETASGTYTYWLAGIDSAGNYGTPGSIAALVNQPPDYQLQSDTNSIFNGTLGSAVKDGTALLTPVNTTETWSQHFTSRGWNTIQDQINAGFQFYATPSAASGSYEEIVDLGALLAASKVTATLDPQAVVGTVVITPTISTRATTSDAWTVYSGVSSAFATNFRYVRVRYDFAASGNNSLLLAKSLNIRVDVKLRNDQGNGTASASDSGGTVVAFNVPFIDVQAIAVTPLTTSAVIAVYDFVDVPNPTSFKVLLFNTSGTRVSGAFSWTASGV